MKGVKVILFTVMSMNRDMQNLEILTVVNFCYFRDSKRIH